VVDYIEFENWPDIEKYKRGHSLDDWSDRERYEFYIELKAKNPMMTDDDLAISIGKRARYFECLKRKIRSGIYSDSNKTIGD